MRTERDWKVRLKVSTVRPFPFPFPGAARARRHTWEHGRPAHSILSRDGVPATSGGPYEGGGAGLVGLGGGWGAGAVVGWSDRPHCAADQGLCGKAARGGWGEADA
ncbi:hypothetical protein Slala05_24120 [Streptomyces lavendulae subsp. lavendulae]|nr:hypothetical protein Slala05_24120 [Streptomyces lavendulae subsp. lavendulae]